MQIPSPVSPGALSNCFRDLRSAFIQIKLQLIFHCSPKKEAIFFAHTETRDFAALFEFRLIVSASF